MKRTRLGPGKKSRERGSTFANHGNGLARGASRDATGRPGGTPTNPPKRPQKPPRGASERERSEAWARPRKPCVICGAHNGEAHHIVTQARLRQKARELGIDAARLLWDRRNRLWLCDRHHKAHHSRKRPVTWEELQRHAPKVFQFVRELDLEPWLERRYPQSNTNAGGSTT